MPEDSNGTKISQADAIAAWSIAARDVLLATARRYHAVVTYKELAAEVQRATAITTTQRLDYWIGRLLENVAVEATRRGEPPLTSLCVHQDGTIGPGYVKAPKSVETDLTIEVDQAAAEHRLLCYRAYAEDLPADGGVPALTPQLVERAARKRKAGPDARPMCDSHFVELSSTGVCFMCD